MFVMDIEFKLITRRIGVLAPYIIAKIIIIL